MLTARNRLMSALRTNYYVQSEAGSPKLLIHNGLYLIENETNGSVCDCRLDGNRCVYPAGVFQNWTSWKEDEPAKNDPPPLFQIPGLMAGCIPLDSMRQSTLECLYNQTCINAISFQPHISRPQSLNQSSTRFPLNSTISSLFDRDLFVESWHNQSSFENYFSACAPRQLSYSYQRRFHLERIVTLTLSAFGGLVLGLKLMTPILIKIVNSIKRKKQQKQPPALPELTTIESEELKMRPNNLRKVVKSHVHRTAQNFNLFPLDNEDARIGIITTRLYLILIFAGLIILAFHTYLSKNHQVKVIPSPSLSTFEELNEKYSSTLNCPCSRFSMSYGRIMSLSPRYHSICSSEYLEDYWFSYFRQVELNFTKVPFLSTDFRISGESFFALLKILCQTSKETIENALMAFRTNRLVTMNALSSKQFHGETQRRLESFQEQTISSFLLVIQLTRSAIQTNQLAEAMWTNLGPVASYNNETSQWSLGFRPRDFYSNSCSTALSNECTRPLGFYFLTDHVRGKPNITVPGLVLACYSTDSLLLSTLECLYDQKCVKLLIDNYYFNVTGLVRPLDSRAVQIKPLSNENSRFFPNTTINEIFSQLFVEDWLSSSNFSSYYTRCEPLQCSYTMRKRVDPAYMFTVMLGFYGGLSSILQIILPPIVLLLLKRWIKRKQRKETETLSTESTLDSSPKNDKKCFSGIYKKVSTFKLFTSNSPSNEKQEIVATRIYIVFFLLSMTVALLYYGPFNRAMKSIEMQNLSIDSVNDLHRKNLSSLSCPCSQVAISYSKVLSLQVALNPICSSAYLSPSYQLDLFEKNQSNSLELITHYRLLSSFCSLSNQFLEDARKVFNDRELLTVETMTTSTFDSTVKSFVSTFIRQTKSNYRRRVLFVMKSFSVNQILNLFSRNWKIGFSNADEDHLIRTSPARFSASNCTCAISSNCHEPLNDQIQIGCFPYDGFRFSNYENISLEVLNNRLFVDTWINQTNYTKYFQACNPLKCQHTVVDKNNPLFIFTTLLGLYGGLTYFLHLIVGQSLLAYRWWTTRNA